MLTGLSMTAGETSPSLGDAQVSVADRVRPLRILYHHRTLADGAEGIHIREMVRALRRLDHKVHVAGLVGEPHEEVSRRSSRWARVARLVPAVAYECAEIGSNVVSRASLMRAVRRFRPDVIYDRYNVYSTAAIAVGLAHQVPVLLEVNTIAYERIAYEHHQLRMPAVASRYEQWICRAAAHVFAVSTPLGRVLVDGCGVDPARLTVLPNGADPVTFRPDVSGVQTRRRLGIGGRVVLGFVGILRPWHGLDLLLEAVVALLARRHDVHALIVGDGPLEAQLRRLAVESCIADRVTFTGRLPHETVRDYVAAMDIAVSPRATFYASPMKILEYMAMGKPVVAPAMDNIRDLIDDGRTGLLFEPDDSRDLVSRIEELIASPERRQAIGVAARRDIEQRLNWSANARVVTATAERLVSERQTAAVRRA
jgi:glycosyltransferase involved in cell wall biosynthesis